MAATWVSMPTGWMLQDVQAALNVLITIFSTLGVFAFVRSCWKHAANQVAKGQDVHVSSLLSLNTIGEAIDAIIILKSHLIRRKHAHILVQVGVVACLSLAAILSGPIARFSTRRGTVVRVQEVDGYLATRFHNGMGYANVEWNLTYSRLDSAGFPYDQLLDYIPENTVDWMYDKNQWNNSWIVDCQQTTPTSFHAEATGNCTPTPREVLGLAEAVQFENYDSYFDDFSGFYDSPETHKDILMFIIGITEKDYNEEQDTYMSLSLMLAAVHMRGVPRNRNSTNGCRFGEGSIGSATVSKVDCQLARKANVQDHFDLAYPDVNQDSHFNLVNALTAYYAARLAQESTSNSQITIIQPEDLIRFYQTYTKIKDLQYRQPVTRQLNVSVTVVQISTVFLGVAGFVAVLIILGLTNYVLFMVCHPRTIKRTPQSKLDWMMQSIRARHDQTTTGPDSSKYGVFMPPETANHHGRGAFEVAMFGRTPAQSWMLRDSAASTQYAGSPDMQRWHNVRESSGQWSSQPSPQAHLEQQHHQAGKAPLLGQTEH